MVDRRRSPRRPAAWDATWTADRSAGSGHVVNVSETGVCIEASPQSPMPERGARIDLSVVVRPDVNLEMRGSVAYVSDAGRMGVALVRVMPADAIILREYAAGRGAP